MNVTSYTRGINGILIDVAGLRDPDGISADDFLFETGAPGGTWSPGPTPASVGVRPSAGVDGSDRVSFAWSTNAVKNGWLRVTVKANANTGLAGPDVFSFGNLIGETGDASSLLRVSALDLTAVRRSLNAAAPITHPADFNRDGRVNALDLAAARGALGRVLPPPPAPAGVAVARVRDEGAGELLK